MGGVLVDNDDAIAGLGDDIGFVQLRPGDTQRPVRWRGGGLLRRVEPGLRHLAHTAAITWLVRFDTG